MSNQKTPTTVTSSMSKKPTAANGNVFPIMSSMGLIGVTISCSMVPISRSLTMAIDVSRRQISMIMMAMTPGTL